MSSEEGIIRIYEYLESSDKVKGENLEGELFLGINMLDNYLGRYFENGYISFWIEGLI